MLGRGRRTAQHAGVAERIEPSGERVLEVSAAMQGSLSFKDPVNLRISGRFEGTLETLGSLTIGDRAQVEAQITGEAIVIAGRVHGKIVAKRSLTLIPPARVSGEVWTSCLAVEAGAILDGICHMEQAADTPQAPHRAGAGSLSAEEVAQYLEVEPSLVRQWAAQGRIPAVRDGESWRFEKERLDRWIASERSR